jgi:phage tail sheath gpL-like
MAIIVNTPSNLRRPGVFPEFDVQVGQSLVPLPLRVAIVAEKTAAGSAALETPIQVFSESDADAKGGVGSLAAVLCRTAIAQAALSGASPELWMCPIAEPGGGTATQWTVTFSNGATAGTLILSVAGRPVIVGVSQGDPGSTVAAGLKGALDAKRALIPFTASVAGNVVTLAHTTKGQNGNDAALAIVQAPVGLNCTIAQTVAGAGAATITNAVQALYDKRYHGIALSNHTSTDITTLVAESAFAWGPQQQNFRYFFIGERGSLGTATSLAAPANDRGIVVGSYEGTPSLSGEIAVCLAVAEFAREAPNANLDGQRVALSPAPGTFAYTAAEIESGLNGGCTTLEPDGAFSKITRLVTTSTTLNGAPFEAHRDIAYSRTMAYLAEQVSIAFRTRFAGANDSPEVRIRVRDMLVEVARAAEAQGYIQEVDALLDQFQVERTTSPLGRYVASVPSRVAGPLHQLVPKFTLYL